MDAIYNDADGDRSHHRLQSQSTPPRQFGHSRGDSITEECLKLGVSTGLSPSKGLAWEKGGEDATPARPPAAAIDDEGGHAGRGGSEVVSPSLNNIPRMGSRSFQHAPSQQGPHGPRVTSLLAARPLQ
eukprot:849127-Prorocentrum_minimum.AAC.1